MQRNLPLIDLQRLPDRIVRQSAQEVSGRRCRESRRDPVESVPPSEKFSGVSSRLLVAAQLCRYGVVFRLTGPKYLSYHARVSLIRSFRGMK